MGKVAGQVSINHLKRCVTWLPDGYSSLPHCYIVTYLLYRLMNFSDSSCNRIQ